ncbi:protein Flattop homolog [Bolinopsis microptera]|uniref:protein Flattop homolog n=1 Tax=Bolinopsis microptera TaxID=2820187 RepID=UPI00307AE0FE
MAFHFSANQYEDAYSSNRLQNYQISDNFRERPVSRRGATKVISNDRGHIMIPTRRSLESPWGDFMGTWDRKKKSTSLGATMPGTAAKTEAPLQVTVGVEAAPPSARSVASAESEVDLA